MAIDVVFENYQEACKYAASCAKETGQAMQVCVSSAGWRVRGRAEVLREKRDWRPAILDVQTLAADIEAHNEWERDCAEREEELYGEHYRPLKF